MPRKGKRQRLDTGIYLDGSGISVCVSGTPEVRYPLGTPLVLLQQFRAARKEQVEKHRATGKATLQRDCAKYKQRKRHLVNQSSVQAELDAWCEMKDEKGRALGTLPRYALTQEHVLDARAAWLDHGVAPKTINHRVNRLRALFHELDGFEAWSPTDGVKPLRVPRTPIQRITPALVLKVIDLMATDMYWRRLRKTIANMLVYATTGRRPSEIGRAKPEDVNFEARVWVPRDGKGGFTPGIYLNDDMLFAWRYFDEVKAWGSFNSRVFPRTIRKYGWPAGVRPYNLRHTIGIILREAHFDVVDVGKGMFGHRSVQTTEEHYTPVLGSAIQQMSTFLDDRFGLGVPQIRSTKAPETLPTPAEHCEVERTETRGKTSNNSMFRK